MAPVGKVIFFLPDYIGDDRPENQDYNRIDAGFIEELNPVELL